MGWVSHFLSHENLVVLAVPCYINWSWLNDTKTNKLYKVQKLTFHTSQEQQLYDKRLGNG